MNERRRTLLFSGGYKIPNENGIYIESVDHDFYLPDDWNSANTVNSIAVITDTRNFRIAPQSHGMTYIISDGTTVYGSVMTAHTPYENDTDGIGNTSKMLQIYSGGAAGYCSSYTFPDGETKGYLPAAGEMAYIHNNFRMLLSVFVKAGIPQFAQGKYWSSSYCGYDQNTSYFAMVTINLPNGFTANCLNVINIMYFLIFGPLEK